MYPFVYHKFWFTLYLQSSLSALISRKTSRKVPAAPRSFSSKSSANQQLGTVNQDFRGHSYHHHTPHQSYLSSSLGTGLGPSGLNASTSSIGSGGGQRDSQSPLIHQALATQAGPLSGSYNTITTTSEIHTNLTHAGSTSALGQSPVESSSGPAGTPVSYPQNEQPVAATLPNLSVEFEDADRSTAFLQLPSD